jgi:DNA-binding MarR family transcriptional regulator
MERAGWIERARDSKDRRVVVARVSKSGLDLLKQIDRPIEDHIQRTSGHMAEKRMRLLVDLLDELRAGFNQQF